MAMASAELKPRKSPLQARALATKDALHTAAIQVLIQEGLVSCTTTGVAKRAGTSVGTLYQYYPNRDALLAAVLEARLDEVAETIEDTCLRLRGARLSAMAAGLVTAFLKIKLGNPDASKALFAIAAERGGAELVLSGNIRMAASIAGMLASASDARFADPAITAAVALSSIVGSVRAVLEGFAPPGFEQRLDEQFVSLVSGYLRNEATDRVAANP